MHNRYDTGRIIDLEKQISDLQAKLERRNTQIADLKYRLEHHQSLQGEITLKLNDTLLKNKSFKHRLEKAEKDYSRGLFEGLNCAKREIQSSIDRLTAVKRIEARMSELNK